MTHSAAEPPSLYAAREPIFPRRVYGKFRTLKWWIMGITLGIYYILPWIRWDRGPNLPDQAVLVDLANRRFYFFFIEIWPQEFYLVAGLLIMAGLGLFLFTAALGRVWCGYTCPQTVWTDLFILVERWIEGDRNARVRLWNQSWNAEKIRKRAFKWTVWLLIAVATGGAWIFYFADAPTLARQFVTLSAPPVAYATVGILTATTFVFGGFMREQVCIYMCPWPRIQSAMVDEQTLTVAYRDWRGEPRGKLRKGPEAESVGDCIDCSACVNVCPTGVDIREGQQLGCITCALCIDACDDVMGKIGRPRGLIDYVTLHDLEAEAAGGPHTPVARRIFRPRILIYFALWSGIGFALVAALFLRTDLTFSIEKVRNPVNITLSDGSVRNAYELRLRNMTGYDRDFRLSVEGEGDIALELQGADGLVVSVPADSTFRQRAYLTAPKDSPAADSDLSPVDIVVSDTGSGRQAREATVFTGRGQ
ncbi:cytochrome c oxidase accessory protein CcoG [Amaricoccus sp.]|uniref:cytochrome c oxidase accessory protein CcoG n=1 Tax=Amaricoccus sp. TaxID=1872485 RepID=UPI001B491EB2|nr:cytochrome c oxidase accessory protein CcoG [Amaricoccus sp.]MBP7003704.1 cytochrome c oxidase accessory protein CcoG [Amaricoccus sp.]